MSEREIQLPVERLQSPWQRLRGLIGQPAPPAGQGVWLAPCRQVHTLWMRYPIDVVHLGQAGEVLSVQTLPPWRIGRYLWRARGVVELVAGEARRLGINTTQTVSLIAK